MNESERRELSLPAGSFEFSENGELVVRNERLAGAFQGGRRQAGQLRKPVRRSQCRSGRQPFLLTREAPAGAADGRGASRTVTSCDGMSMSATMTV